MRIAVDTRFLHSDEHPQLKNFTRNVIIPLAVNSPQHHFIFLFDSFSKDNETFPANVTGITLKREHIMFFSVKWFNSFRLPALLKKYKADLFIDTYGCASLLTSVPRLIIVHRLPLIETSSVLRKTLLFFQKKVAKKRLRQARWIATNTQFIKQTLVDGFNLPEKKISIIGLGVNPHIKPVDWEQREIIKQNYADGCEYFVFEILPGKKMNLFFLFKAFSIFKKWQKTNMKLMLLGKTNAHIDKQIAKLETYKYKSEVFVKINMSEKETQKFIAAAYAALFMCNDGSDALRVLETMQSNVPVIACKQELMKEIVSNAALYSESNEPSEMAEHMKSLYKNEALRNDLIQKGQQQLLQYSCDKTRRLLSDLIEKTVSA